MPEGPECHVIGNRMNKYLAGKHLRSIDVLGGRYKTHGSPDLLEDLNTYTKNTETLIEYVAVKGKLIYIVLDGPFVVLSTLGLSGSWRTRKAPKHSDLVIRYGEGKSLWFTDQRHYGTLKVINKADLEKELKKRGPDILSEEGVPREYFIDLCNRYPHWTFPKLLMNQAKLSGIGNYLKAEILYAACVNPELEIVNISEEKIEKVYEYMHSITRAALAYKGVSLRDYVQPDGTTGSYQFRLKVYNRRKDPQGRKILKSKTADGRTTHWVPEVQT